MNNTLPSINPTLVKTVETIWRIHGITIEYLKEIIAKHVIQMSTRYQTIGHLNEQFRKKCTTIEIMRSQMKKWNGFIGKGIRGY